MAVTLTQPNSVAAAAKLDIKAIGWYKSDGTFVVANEDTPLPTVNTPGALPATATASPSSTVNIGAAAAGVIKASSGNVFSISCINTNAAVRYFQLHNKATIPLSTEVPVYCFTVPAAGAIVIGEDFFNRNGLNFVTGIGYAISTTFLTYTAATAAEHVSSVQFK